MTTREKGKRWTQTLVNVGEGAAVLGDVNDPPQNEPSSGIGELVGSILDHATILCLAPR